MKSKRHYIPPLPAPPSGFAAGPMAVALVALLALVWFVASFFNFDAASTLAAAMAIAVPGLLAVAMRSALASGVKVMAPAPGAADGGISPAKTQHAIPSSPEDIATPLIGEGWSLDVFAAIDAKRFAAVCETWFSWAGFDTRSESHRTDEGVDIWLHAAKKHGPIAIVRCKHGRNKPVGLQEMEEFLGIVAVHKSAHGTYTTTSTYTAEALQFAKEHGIDAVDGPGLLRKIRIRTRQSQQALLAVAYSGQS